MKPIEDNAGGSVIAWISGLIVVIAAAIAAIPRLCRAVIATARMAVAFSDVMPVVLRLPSTLKAHGQTLESQNKVLADIQRDVKELKELKANHAAQANDTRPTPREAGVSSTGGEAGL